MRSTCAAAQLSRCAEVGQKEQSGPAPPVEAGKDRNAFDQCVVAIVERQPKSQRFALGQGGSRSTSMTRGRPGFSAIDPPGATCNSGMALIQMDPDVAVLVSCGTSIDERSVRAPVMPIRFRPV